MSLRRQGGPWLARGVRRYRVGALLAILALGAVTLLMVGRRPSGPPSAVDTPPSLAHRTPYTAPSISPVSTPTLPGCTGVPLTAQAQVRPDTSYCGGTITSQIHLADGDTWVGGEVTGVSAGRQDGAVTCASRCTLANMNVHDNPAAFAGIYVSPGDNTEVAIIGGRVTGSGSLGIGGAGTDGLIIHDVEIAHNGASARCGFEGGGFKAGGTHHLHFFNNYVHDNNCPGVWLDINSSTNEIDHNRIINNTHEGIFYEISQGGLIHDNDVRGNGFRTNGNGCTWLWGGGITIASSFDIEVYANTLSGNCNGITGTQQNRRDSVPPVHLLDRISVHNNSIQGPGRTGVVTDTGADLTARNIVFAGNGFLGGAVMCGLAC